MHRSPIRSGRLVPAVLVLLAATSAAAQSEGVRPVRREQPTPIESEFPDRGVPEPRRITRADERTGPIAAVHPPKRANDSLWSTAVGFVAILGIAFAAAVFWRKRGGLTPGLPREALEILGRRPLDPRQSLWLVRVGSRILVLGSSPAGMHAVSEIADPVEVDLLAGQCRRPAEEGGASFRTLLAGRGAARPRNETSRGNPREAAHGA